MTKFQVFMNQRGLTQYRLHKLTEFTKGQISEWQSGKHRPSKSSARRLAISLRLPIEDVMGQLETRERTQNARSKAGLFVPKSRKTQQTLASIIETIDSGRTPPAFCALCHRELIAAQTLTIA